LSTPRRLANSIPKYTLLGQASYAAPPAYECIQRLRLPFLPVRPTGETPWQDQCSLCWVACWRRPFARSKGIFSTRIDPSCITCAGPAQNGGRNMNFNFSRCRSMGLRLELGSSFNPGGEYPERERTRQSGARPHPERSASVMRPSLHSVGRSTQQSATPSRGPATSLFPRLIGRLLCLVMLTALALVLLLAWLNERWPNTRINRRQT
jgi:hypothetical protein